MRMVEEDKKERRRNIGLEKFNKIQMKECISERRMKNY